MARGSLADRLEIIKKLYYQEQLPVSRISKKLGVSAWAIYSLMRRRDLRRRSFSEQNAVRFSRKPPSFKVRRKLSPRDQILRASGIMLYWAEGFQSASATMVDFANSRPEMVKLFALFLRRICGVKEKKLRAFLYCYGNQNVKKLISFWSSLTKISKRQFTKPYIRADYRVDKIDKMPYGLIHIRYHDKKLLELIKSWIVEHVQKFAQVVP